MAEGHVDVKRYQIISLLYIVFICFSVINIKISVLDSNIYTIKSLQSLDKEELKKVDISNKIIEDNIDLLNKSSKAASYLKIRTRLNASSKVVYGVLKHVDDEFANNKTSLSKQFNSRNLIEEILKSDNGIKLLEKDLFDLSEFIKKSPYKIQTSLDSLIPIQKVVTTIKGKEEAWEYYLFMHKPSAISYMQLERIKLLITKTQLLYQEAALAEIGYQPTYFSQFNPKLYVLKANIKEYKEEEIIQPGQKVISVNDEVFDDLFKKILASLHTENIFVGLNNTLLSDFDFMMGKDFEVEILPKVNVIKSITTDFPVTETADSWITHGVAVEDIQEAMKSACEEAAGLLVNHWGFTYEDAFIFLSVASDLGIAQNVHPCEGTVIAKVRVPKISACPKPFKI